VNSAPLIEDLERRSFLYCGSKTIASTLFKFWILLFSKFCESNSTNTDQVNSLGVLQCYTLWLQIFVSFAFLK